MNVSCATQIKKMPLDLSLEAFYFFGGIMKESPFKTIDEQKVILYKLKKKITIKQLTSIQRN